MIQFCLLGSLPGCLFLLFISKFLSPPLFFQFRLPCLYPCYLSICFLSSPSACPFLFMSLSSVFVLMKQRFLCLSRLILSFASILVNCILYSLSASFLHISAYYLLYSYSLSSFTPFSAYCLLHSLYISNTVSNNARFSTYCLFKSLSVSNIALFFAYCLLHSPSVPFILFLSPLSLRFLFSLSVYPNFPYSSCKSSLFTYLFSCLPPTHWYVWDANKQARET